MEIPVKGTDFHSPIFTKELVHYMFIRNSGHNEHIFSSPEHEVLMVSYCGQWLSVVRRASCVNIWCLHSIDHICDTIFLKLVQNICFDNI